MKTKRFFILALSLASGWAGYALAIRSVPQTGEIATIKSVAAPGVRPRPSGGATSREENSSLTLRRRAAARCESAALWDFLASAGDPRGTNYDQLASVVELYDREGPSAFDHALALDDPASRRHWSGEFLKLMAAKDPAAAFAIYQAHRSELGETWGAEAVSEIAGAACTVSADHLISIFQGSLGKEPYCFHNTPAADYPADFDFRKVLDYLSGNSGGVPQGMPGNLTVIWAGRDPAAALDWLQDHPDAGYPGPFGVSSLRDSIQAIVKSPAPLRDAALLRLAQYPMDQRNAVWTAFSSPDGKIDPGLLASAAAMDAAPAYLVPTLLTTRYQETLDPSWASVPAELRQQAVAQMLAKWTQDDPSPVAEKARQRWQARLEKP